MCCRLWTYQLDDLSRAARDHAGQHLATAEERAAQIDGEHGVPFVRLDLPDLALARVETGIVDQYVDAAKRLARLCDHAPDVFLQGDVSDGDQGRPPSLSLDLLSERVQLGGGARGNDHTCASNSHREGRGAPDAPARAGDDYDLVLHSSNEE